MPENEKLEVHKGEELGEALGMEVGENVLKGCPPALLPAAEATRKANATSAEL